MKAGTLMLSPRSSPPAAAANTNSVGPRNEDTCAPRSVIAQMPVIVVTREMGFAREVADTMVFLGGGGGLVRSPGGPERPQRERTKPFLSKVL